MHNVERKQESLSNNFAESVINELSDDDSNIDEVSFEIKPKPIIQDDESFAKLATRIVDEVVTNQSPKSLAKQVLKQAGIQ